MIALSHTTCPHNRTVFQISSIPFSTQEALQNNLSDAIEESVSYVSAL